MRTTSIVALCGLLAILGATPSLGAAPSPTPADQRQGAGMAIATVIHPLTNRPIAGMPVIVQEQAEPELVGTAVFKTGDDGRALIGPLETGRYIAYVSFNERQSDPVVFEVNGDTDFIVEFTIYFNPDIDVRTR